MLPNSAAAAHTGGTRVWNFKFEWEGALLWPPWHGLAAGLNIWLRIAELPYFLTFYDTIFVTFFEDYPPKTTNYDQ